MEETLKYLGVILLVLIARTQFPTILSVVVIGATVGLGFQVVEDLTYSINAASTFPIDNEVLPVLLMFGTRGIATGVFSHAMYTSISAFGLGYFLVRRDKPLLTRLLVAVGAFAAAWGLHFFWNSPAFADLGFVGSTAIKAIPVFVVGYLIWRLAGKEEGGYLENLADHLVADDLITPDERTRLTALHLRRAARKATRKQHGRAAARALHSLQREQIRLVMYHARYGAGPHLGDHEYAVHRARARVDELTAARHR